VADRRIWEFVFTLDGFMFGCLLSAIHNCESVRMNETRDVAGGPPQMSGLTNYLLLCLPLLGKS
jgi:hypothetical protein